MGRISLRTESIQRPVRIALEAHALDLSTFAEGGFRTEAMGLAEQEGRAQRLEALCREWASSAPDALLHSRSFNAEA